VELGEREPEEAESYADALAQLGSKEVSIKKRERELLQLSESVFE